jgi:hypothetical protein
MNIISCFGENPFLLGLFPDGLTEDVLIGQIGLDVGGLFRLNIHTKQRPKKEVAKWGIHGQHYDVIVIKLLGNNFSEIHTESWKDITYAQLNCTMENEAIKLQCGNDVWQFSASFGSLTFQGCTTYID